MVPREGIEPSTSPLPRVRSTTEPPRHIILQVASGWQAIYGILKEPQAGKPATAIAYQVIVRSGESS